jgi:AcrR family transcriptional regulator
MMVQAAERADARANRARILAAAVALFAERGVEAEMREIADRAGLAVGTVYNHFPSKDDLIVAVLHEALIEVEQATERASMEPDAVPAIRTFLRLGLAVAERYGALMAAMSEGRVAALHKKAVDEARRSAVAQRVAGIVARGVADGTFRADLDVEVATAVLWSVFLPWTLTALRRTRDIDQIVDALMSIFLRGAGAETMADGNAVPLTKP